MIGSWNFRLLVMQSRVCLQALQQKCIAVYGQVDPSTFANRRCRLIKNCLFQCTGAMALPLPPFWDVMSLFVTVLTLNALSSVSEQAVKRAKNQPFLLLRLCGTVAWTRETLEIQLCWPRLE